MTQDAEVDATPPAPEAASPEAAPTAAAAPAGGAAPPAAPTAAAATAAATGGPESLGLVMDVPVRVTVEVGGAKLLVREVLQFDKGSVIELDRASGEPADLLVNGKLLARGEVTVVDDRLAVRVVEVVDGMGGERGA